MSDEDPDAKGKTADEGTNTSNDSEKTFTSAEMEAIIKDRLARQKSKYSDYDSLKKKAAEADTLRQSTLSEAERAVEIAREEGRIKARGEYASLLAAAEIKAALSNIVDDVDGVVEDLNLSKFVEEDGSIDKEAIKALQTKYTGLVGKASRSNGSRVGHGRRDSVTSESPADSFARVIGGLLDE